MSLERTTWRLLVTPPARGAWNMAIDQAILEFAGSGDVLPTLRLYAWDPPCLSLGYAQPYADADARTISQLGWEMVRRPTGGRAILHTDELTYSVIGPANEPRLAGSVLESYQRLSQALLAALRQLGIPADAIPQPDLAPGRDPKGPVCFEVPSNYEIVVGGRKLVGSAQARRREGVLQHGSFPLSGDLGRITQALVFSNEQQRILATARVHLRAVTAEEVLGYPPSWESAADSFVHAFESTLQLDLRQEKLSDAEASRATELIANQYDSPAWTARI